LIGYAAMGHSTASAEDFERRAMADVRWHPVDNLAEFGAHGFADAAALRQLLTQKFGKAGNSALPCEPSGEGVKWSSDSCLLPFGQLQHVGRVLHAMADASVPGHISGRLLAAEHIIFENDAANDVDDFRRYTEKASKMGALVPSYAGDGQALFELDWLVDSDVVEDLVAREFRDGKAVQRFTQATTEVLVEEAAKRTADAVLLMGSGLSDDTKRVRKDIRRRFLSLTIANQALGATKAIQVYYDRHAATKAIDLAARVTWTSKDVELVYAAIGAQDQAKGFKTFLAPTLGTETSKAAAAPGASKVDLDIDYGYQDYTFGTDDCFVIDHNWCWSDKTVDKPCLAGQKPSKPRYMRLESLTADLVLSSANRGGLDEMIHVTGKYPDGINKTYYQGLLTNSAGAVVHLPAGALTDGVASWCSGPDIWNDQDVVYDASGKATLVPRVVCQIGELRPTNAMRCDATEHALLHAHSSEPTPPVATPVGVPVVVSPADIATRYGAEPSSLTRAMSTAEGRDVTLLDPAPEGRAQVIWSEPNGLQATTTITRDGGVVTRRTRAQ
jgi:hypothetical protein